MTLSQLLKSWVKLSCYPNDGIIIKVYYWSGQNIKDGIWPEDYLFANIKDLKASRIYNDYINDYEVGIFTDYTNYDDTDYAEKYPFHITVNEPF